MSAQMRHAILVRLAQSGFLADINSRITLGPYGLVYVNGVSYQILEHTARIVA